jgi:septin family protein
LDLVESTHSIHYERFRAEKIATLATQKAQSQPMAQFESEKQRFEQATAQKEDDMSASFRAMVKQQEQQMKSMESELLLQHDTLERKLNTKQLELNRKREQFAQEKAVLAASNKKPPGSGLF